MTTSPAAERQKDPPARSVDDGETVLQLNSMGPRRVIYVDPAEDPRSERR